MSDPTRSEELHRQYDRALTEYRFQVDLNWRRSEYFFVLNVGVLIAAATMFSSDAVPQELVAVLFLIGALLAVLSVFANEAQHSYYRAARALKRDLEQHMNLGDLALATTPGMGSSFRRLGRVRTFLKIMLISIALVDIGGAAFALDEAIGAGHQEQEAERAVLIHVEPFRRGAWSVLTVSRGAGSIEVKSLPAKVQRVLLELRPGKYLVSLGGRSICRREIEVNRAPLQLISLRCGR